MHTPRILTGLAAALTATALHAQLVVNDTSPKIIDFNATLSGVWFTNGTPTGSIGQSAPTNSNPIDSDAWALRAGSTADLTLPAASAGSGSVLGFGGTSAAGAISRGVSGVAGWGTSGLGIVTGVTSGASFGNALGFRPQGGSTDNATVFLRIQNTTGQTVTSWKIDYDLFYIDIGVATSGSFAFSSDGGTSFSSPVVSLGFSTPGTNSIITPAVTDWTLLSLTETTISATVANNDYLILRWGLGNDVASGNLNRIAIDNIAITAIPEPTTWAALAGAIALSSVLLRRRRA